MHAAHEAGSEADGLSVVESDLPANTNGRIVRVRVLGGLHHIPPGDSRLVRGRFQLTRTKPWGFLSLMTTTAQHHYRIEISGGHTGSSYLYRSGVFGSLDEAERALTKELSAPEMFSFLICDTPHFVVEHYEDGVLQGSKSAFPAVTLGLPEEHTLSFTAEGKLEGFEIDDSETIFDDPVLGPLLGGDVDPVVTVRLAALGLPSPRGPAAPAGGELVYEHHGDRVMQPCGWFGSFDEPDFRPRKNAAAKQAAVKEATLKEASRKQAAERRAAKDAATKAKR